MRTTLGNFLRLGALVLALGMVPLVPAWAQMVLDMPSAAQSAQPQQKALALAVGKTLQLNNLRLDEAHNTATAELQRIAVVNANTRFIEHIGDQARTLPLPVRAHFSGQLAGEPDSSVFVSIDGEGVMRSIIDRGGAVFVNEVRPQADQRPALAMSRRIDQKTDFAERTFSCGVTPEFIAEIHPPADRALQQILNSASHREAAPKAGALAVQHRADLIIETDHELFQRFGDSSRLAGYITDLFGYINARYQGEIGTRLNLTQVNIYPTPADPWMRTSAGDQLDDLQRYWNEGARAAQPRHHVHLLSAKDGGGGVAYLGVLGDRFYSYGVSTEIEGSFSAANPQLVWDALGVAHEIGHSFGSTHTHNYDKPYLGSSQGGAIDCCYADSTNSQCGGRNGGVGGFGVLPGIGAIDGGQPRQGAGTIMSYCHLLGSYSNISFNFGTNHPYGVNAGRVADVMRTSAQTYLPLDTVSPPVSYMLSVARTGSGSISSSPGGIQCGTDCNEAYAAGTTVTLTASAATGSVFGSWSGACSGSANSCNVTMNDARNVGAVFTLVSTSRLITVSKSGFGSGSISSAPAGLSCAAVGCSTASASFPSTTGVTLTAASATGSSFGGWGGACAGTAANSCTLAAGTATLNVTAAFNVNSGAGGTLTNSTLFVTQQYYDLFNRSPDSASLNYWVGQLQTGAISQAALIESFMAQPDFKDRYGLLVRLYTAYFQRMPDYAGLMYWYGEMYPDNGSGGRLVNHVSESFAQSPEFITTYGALSNGQFVERVYQNVLGRAAEPAGRDYWMGRLNAGLIRGEMMIGFSESAENIGNNRYANSITMTYAGMLRRMPTAAQQTTWLADMKAGRTTQLKLIDWLLNSAEYKNRFQ